MPVLQKFLEVMWCLGGLRPRVRGGHFTRTDRRQFSTGRILVECNWGESENQKGAENTSF